MIEPSYYWARPKTDVPEDQRLALWEPAEVIEDQLYLMGCGSYYDLEDFIFGPRLQPPEDE